ncbi:cohesin subunit SA-1-like isoform X4 [Leptonychotes weddellii]|uniref:Cohesin subunit SA-1-like isoform X4 n=1 Tax=Leptonychotes weddellii TaxID=9713 RepID=A0A7F8Q6E0_LEPWE|nr:cohesin subunit SA-1-like isoform X4 [Leptonychotes weddellii]
MAEEVERVSPFPATDFCPVTLPLPPSVTSMCPWFPVHGALAMALAAPLSCLDVGDIPVHCAFILLCDLLLILSHQGPEEDKGLGLLFFVPDHVLQCKLLTFVREHVFLEDTGAAGPSRVYKEEDADELHELFHRRNMLAVFCKLIVCNVLEMSAAADIYQFYLKVSAWLSRPRGLSSPSPAHCSLVTTITLATSSRRP